MVGVKTAAEEWLRGARIIADKLWGAEEAAAPAAPEEAQA
jgi:hypothetical protein